jgi:hypothetical protein
VRPAAVSREAVDQIQLEEGSLEPSLPLLERSTALTTQVSALDHTEPDWYEFVSCDYSDRVTMILNVDGALEPSHGPITFPTTCFFLNCQWRGGSLLVRRFRDCLTRIPGSQIGRATICLNSGADRMHLGCKHPDTTLRVKAHIQASGLANGS